MAAGRAHVYPQALLFGSRTVSMPGRGTVLCASLGLPFQLADFTPVKPERYYQVVAANVGKTAVPDTMAPLPGAELLVLGPLARPTAPRDVHIRCGAIVASLRLFPDAEAAPDAPFLAGPEEAVWHDAQNTVGRGAAADPRKPLIVLRARPELPVWLGATPFEHPARTRLAGVSQTIGADGWPSDADPAVLYEAHPVLRADSLHAGDPLEMEGLSERKVELTLPPYRAVMATSRSPAGRWHAETARIHTIVVIPSAGIGALFWRASVPLGDDVLAEGITAVVAALEDIDAPGKDEQDLGILAAERWLEPTRSLDDRPFLPTAMAAVGAPPPPPDASDHEARHAAAEEWAQKEFGAGAENPFAEPEAVTSAKEAMDSAAQEQTPDVAELEAIGRNALAQAKQRHAEAGFPEPDAEAQRPPTPRGEALAAEARERLGRPYRAPREVQLAAAIAEAPADAGLDAEETLGRLAEARILAFEPTVPWPAFTEEEAERFGDAVIERLVGGDPPRHIDVCGAVIGGRPGDAVRGVGPQRRHVVSGRTVDGLLAEETQWRDVDFENCTLRDVTFTKAVFDNCLFRDCTFERVNFSHAGLNAVTFSGCVFREQSTHGLNCVGVRFDDCGFENVTFVDLAMRDSRLDGGSWTDVEITDSLLVRVAARDMQWHSVTLTLCHAPEWRFERVAMSKVWVMGLGFPGSTFEQVEADTCGFLSEAHFQQTRFERCRFRLTGFGNAKFHETEFAPGCIFERCDFGGAEFPGARIPGTRFLECSMPMTVWAKVDASDSWFMDCILRGVNFNDTQLLNAVFAGADIEGMKFADHQVIGADFRGTVRDG